MRTYANGEDPDVMRYFGRVCTVCLDKNDHHRKKIATLVGNYNMWPINIYMYNDWVIAILLDYTIRKAVH